MIGSIIKNRRAAFPCTVIVHDEGLPGLGNPAGHPFAQLQTHTGGKRVTQFSHQLEIVRGSLVQVDETTWRFKQCHRAFNNGVQKGEQIQWNGQVKHGSLQRNHFFRAMSERVF